jgi:putative ABC transport system permease protein
LHNKLFTFINMVGLSVGMASCILLILHVRYELSFDKFHTNRDQLFRIVSQSAYTPYPMAPAIKAELPHVKDFCRIGQFDFLPVYIIQKNNPVAEKGLMFVDSTFFKIFSFELLSGNKNQTLQNAGGILLSKSLALKYFGSIDIIGKTIDIKQFGAKNTFTVEGIFKDIPINSSFQATMIGSMLQIEKIWGAKALQSWTSNSFKTYLLLDNKESATALNSEITSLYQKNIGEKWAKEKKFRLQPFTGVHLYSSDFDDSETKGSITKIMIFSTIAILILLIALINFITLSTAQSFNRLKEFGIKKVFGASRINLIKNVTYEFLIIYLISTLFAFILIGFLKPVFTNSFSFRMPPDLRHSFSFICAFVIFTLLTGFLASGYITWFISRRHPIEVLKNKLVSGKSKNIFRGILVIFQFFILTVLIICSLAIVKQNKLLDNKDLGFDKQSLLVLTLPIDLLTYVSNAKNYRLVIDKFRGIPGIISISGAAYLPPEQQEWTYDFKKQNDTEFRSLETVYSDYNLIETMGIKLLSGRMFSNSISSDSISNIIINELAAKKLGFSNPVGESIIMKGQNESESLKTIIGVVKDFHMRSLYQDVEPMVMLYALNDVRLVVMRIAPYSVDKTLKEVKNEFNKVYPEEAFEYTFVAEGLKAKYISESRLQSVVMFFSFLAISISMLGLLGLAIYTTQKRIREIGLRKVNGAKSIQIIIMLNNGFLKWIAFAFIIACPVAYFALDKWLQSFAYKTELSWWLFLMAGAIALTTALITVSSLSWQAATRNPVECLRYE